MTYCFDCGTPLELRQVEGRGRAFCPRCERIHYAQLKVGAGALVERDGRLLLLRRTRAPFKGCWNLPAGYVESDESPAEGVVREAYEEVGLRVEARRLVDVYFFDDDPRGNGILIVYACRPAGGEPRPSQEGSDPTFFLRENVPLELAGGGHDQAVRAWKRRVGEPSVADRRHARGSRRISPDV
jgi:ADP-ribose pyrophosphatase YjhB (NUDIX family)